MRRMLLYTAAGLLPALGLLGGASAQQPAKAGATCGGDHGTEVKFFKSPSEAAKEAAKQEKLVFVLHISGLFEDPDFT